jgi:hypothetical protein
LRPSPAALLPELLQPLLRCADHVLQLQLLLPQLLPCGVLQLLQQLHMQPQRLVAPA